MFFWIRVENFMLSVRLVLEICGLKVVVSFNFALGTPHVKRRVKCCEPSAAAATIVCGLLDSLCTSMMEVRTAFFKFLNMYYHILEPKMNWFVQCWCNELVFLWMILVAAVAGHFYILRLSRSCLFSTWDVPCLGCDGWATFSGISLCSRVLYWDTWYINPAL